MSEKWKTIQLRQSQYDWLREYAADQERRMRFVLSKIVQNWIESTRKQD